MRVILRFAPSGSIYCDCRAADDEKKGPAPRASRRRGTFVCSFFACLLLYTALRCNNHRFSKSLMGMTTLGEVYRMSRMSRRCPEDVQKVSRRCPEGVQKVSRRLLVKMQLYLPLNHQVSCKPRLARRLETSLPSGPFSPSGTTHSHTPIHARPAPLILSATADFCDADFWGGYPFGVGREPTLLELSVRSRHGRACEAPVPPVKPMLSPLPPSRLARHLASPQGSSLAPAASLCRSPAPAPPTSCTATRDAPPSRTACIRYSRRAFATTWIACHCKRARSRALKVCRAG